MKKMKAGLFLSILSLSFYSSNAQKKLPAQKQEQCATMQRLNSRLARNSALKSRFNQQLETFNRAMTNVASRPLTTDGIAGVTYTIPVVFHIVLSDQSLVTDAQVMSQLDILNKNYSGTTADSSGIPSYFKSIFGKSTIQFCLAQRTPDNENTTGIDRITTTKASFSANDDGVKHGNTGGTNIWDGSKYLNVWVCALADNLLGYGTFPDDGQPGEQGVVVEYRCLPGGAFDNYSGGKTLTHETGHYFNLYHIWGDDDGECTGTDYVDDTPNQGNSSSGCFTGIKTDNCTTTGSGILYQDYMDYSYDKCMLLFTTQQAKRMETALLTYRPSLTTSNACTPVIAKTLDAQLKTIESPEKRICANSFAPVVTIVNKGAQTLTSLVISAVVDKGNPVNYAWTGSLATLATGAVTLNTLTIGPGNHSLKIFVSAPNAGADENNANDTLSTTVQYYDAVSAISEGFEGDVFPPQGWDIVNPDQLLTWKKVTGIAKTGKSSVTIDNFDYTEAGEKDYLRLPSLSLANVDSAYLFFQVAAATFSATSISGNNWDTLEVLISKDCGATYTSLYKKWGATLVTTPAATTLSFEPGISEWRNDSVSLTPYINAGPVMIAFRNTTEYENNIYLDDINLKTQVINPNLKASGFLVTPNPASDNISVQFYPNPVNLKSIQLYNMLGQKLAETNISSATGATTYNFNISRYAAGTYIIRAVFADKVWTKKIIKD